MIELSVEQHGLQALGRALKAEADGSKLRRDLAKEIRGALDPAVSAVKSAVMAMPSSGLAQAEGAPLRQAVASKVRAEVRLSGRSTGARIKARKKGMPRGFDNAPRRLNSRKGWRHRVYGGGVWVQQMGEPGWFDDHTQDRATEYRAAVLRAMEAAAERLQRAAR